MLDWDTLFETSGQRLHRIYRETFPQSLADHRQSQAEMYAYRDAQRWHYHRLWKDLDRQPHQPDDLDLPCLAVKDEPMREIVLMPRPPRTLDLDQIASEM